jgi:hypothetical protein
MRLHRFRGDRDKRPWEIPWRRWLVLCLFIGTGAVAVGVMLAWPGADKEVVAVVVAVALEIIAYRFPPPADGLGAVLR